MKTPRNRRTRQTRFALANANQHAAAADANSKPVRGVKMKHLSAFTMMFAVLCLFAYIAGRVDASAAASPAQAAQTSQTEKKEKPMYLGLRTAKYSVQDLAKAKAWYTNLLGFPPYFEDPTYIGYNVGGFELGLVPDPKAELTRPSAGVAYWGVQDAHAAYKRLLSLGAAPVQEVVDVGGGVLIAEVRDPFGNIIGVVQNPYFKLAPQ